jgi:hypothetical protein
MERESSSLDDISQFLGLFLADIISRFKEARPMSPISRLASVALAFAMTSHQVDALPNHIVCDVTNPSPPVLCGEHFAGYAGLIQQCIQEEADALT